MNPGTRRGVFLRLWCALAILTSAIYPLKLHARRLKCGALVKQALHAIQVAEKNSRENLNLEWDPLIIAESAFNETNFLERVPLRLDAKNSEKFQASLQIEAQARALINEYGLQNKSKYNRERLDNLKGPLHETIERYLPMLGINLFRKKEDVFYGPYFTYISIKGDHPLNRAARTIYNEYGLHLMISGASKIRVFQDYIQIPPQLFGTSAGIDEILKSLTTLLVNTNSLPSILVNTPSPGRNMAQDQNGNWKSLNWDDYENQVVRVKFRGPPSSTRMSELIPYSEQLLISKPSLQRVHSIESLTGYLPSPAKEQAAKSLSKRIRENEKPYMHIAIEAADRWYEIWPVDAEPANIDSMSSYINVFVKDLRFLSAIAGLPEIRFHIIIGDRDLKPITASDLEMFEDMKSEIHSAIHTVQKRFPFVHIHYLKVSLNRGEVIMFEPVQANPDEIEPK